MAQELILWLICVVAENELSLTHKYVKTNLFTPKNYNMVTS